MGSLKGLGQFLASQHRDEIATDELNKLEMVGTEISTDPEYLAYRNEHAKRVELMQRLNVMQTRYMARDLNLANRFITQPMSQVISDVFTGVTDKDDALSTARLGTYIIGTKIPDPKAIAPLLMEGAIATVDTAIDKGRALEDGGEWDERDYVKSWLGNYAGAVGGYYAFRGLFRGLGYFYKKGMGHFLGGVAKESEDVLSEFDKAIRESAPTGELQEAINEFDVTPKARITGLDDIEIGGNYKWGEETIPAMPELDGYRLPDVETTTMGVMEGTVEIVDGVEVYIPRKAEANPHGIHRAVGGELHKAEPWHNAEGLVNPDIDMPEEIIYVNDVKVQLDNLRIEYSEKIDNVRNKRSPFKADGSGGEFVADWRKTGKHVLSEYEIEEYEMSPEEYLRLAIPQHRDRLVDWMKGRSKKEILEAYPHLEGEDLRNLSDEAVLTHMYMNRDMEAVQRYADDMVNMNLKDGGFHRLMLSGNRYGNLTGHEGVHRAFASIKAGVKKVPVKISWEIGKWKEADIKALLRKDLNKFGTSMGIKNTKGMRREALVDEILRLRAERIEAVRGKYKPYTPDGAWKVDKSEYAKILAEYRAKVNKITSDFEQRHGLTIDEAYEFLARQNMQPKELTYDDYVRDYARHVLKNYEIFKKHLGDPNRTVIDNEILKHGWGDYVNMWAMRFKAKYGVLPDEWYAGHMAEEMFKAGKYNRKTWTLEEVLETTLKKYGYRLELDEDLAEPIMAVMERAVGKLPEGYDLSFKLYLDESREFAKALILELENSEDIPRLVAGLTGEKLPSEYVKAFQEANMMWAEEFKRVHGMYPDDYYREMALANGGLVEGKMPTLSGEVHKALGHSIGQEKANILQQKFDGRGNPVDAGDVNNGATKTPMTEIKRTESYGNSYKERKIREMTRGLPSQLAEKWYEEGILTYAEKVRYMAGMSRVQAQELITRTASVRYMRKQLNWARRIAVKLRDDPNFQRFSTKDRNIGAMTYMYKLMVRAKKDLELQELFTSLQDVDDNIVRWDDAFDMIRESISPEKTKGSRGYSSLTRALYDPEILPEGKGKEVATILSDYIKSSLGMYGDMAIRTDDVLLRSIFEEDDMFKKVFHVVDEITDDMNKKDILLEYGFDFEGFKAIVKAEGFDPNSRDSVKEFVEAQLKRMGKENANREKVIEDTIMSMYDRASNSQLRGIELSQLYFSKKNVLHELGVFRKIKDGKAGSPTEATPWEEFQALLKKDKELAEKWDVMKEAIREHANNVDPESISKGHVGLRIETINGKGKRVRLTITNQTTVGELNKLIGSKVTRSGLGKLLTDGVHRQIGKDVSAEAGTKDFNQIVSFLKRKYGIADIEVVHLKKGQSAKRGVYNVPFNPDRYGMFRPAGHKDNPTGKMFIYVRDTGDNMRDIGTLRHEFEHALEHAKGLPDDSYTDVFDYKQLVVEDDFKILDNYDTVYKGHFIGRRGSSWEADFLKDIHMKEAKYMDFTNDREVFDFMNKLYTQVNQSTKNQGRRVNQRDIARLFKSVDSYHEFMHTFGGGDKVFREKVTQALTKNAYMRSFGMTKGQLIASMDTQKMMKYESEMNMPLAKDGSYVARDTDTGRILGLLRSSAREVLSFDPYDTKHLPTTFMERLFEFVKFGFSRAFVGGGGSMEAYSSLTMIANQRIASGEDYGVVMKDLWKEMFGATVNYGKIGAEGLMDSTIGTYVSVMRDKNLEDIALVQAMRKFMGLSEFEVNRFQIDDLMRDLYEFGEDLGGFDRKMLLASKSSFRSLAKGDYNSHFKAMLKANERVVEIFKTVQANIKDLKAGKYAEGEGLLELFDSTDLVQLQNVGMTNDKALIDFFDEIVDSGYADAVLENRFDLYNDGELPQAISELAMSGLSHYNVLGRGRHATVKDPTTDAFMWLFNTTRAIFHDTKEMLMGKYDGGVYRRQVDTASLVKTGLVLTTASMPLAGVKMMNFVQEMVAEERTAVEQLREELRSRKPHEILLDTFKGLTKNSELGIILGRTGGSPLRVLTNDIMGDRNPQGALADTVVRGIVGANLYSKYNYYSQMFGGEEANKLFDKWLDDGATGEIQDNIVKYGDNVLLDILSSKEQLISGN